jgi:hypothetical protein
MMLWGPFVAALLWAHSHQPVAPERCTLRLTAKGLYVDGDLMTRHQAIVQCKRTTGAVVVVGNDAPSGAWTELRRHLDRERITFMLRGEVNDGPGCLENPLAKGCLVGIPKSCIDDPLANGCH